MRTAPVLAEQFLAGTNAYFEGTTSDEQELVHRHTHRVSRWLSSGIDVERPEIKALCVPKVSPEVEAKRRLSQRRVSVNIVPQFCPKIRQRSVPHAWTLPVALIHPAGLSPASLRNSFQPGSQFSRSRGSRWGRFRPAAQRTRSPGRRSCPPRKRPRLWGFRSMPVPALPSCAARVAPVVHGPGCLHAGRGGPRWPARPG